MESRTLGRTGRSVSVVGLGCWQLGADWGSVSEADALAVLRAIARPHVASVQIILNVFRRKPLERVLRVREHVHDRW